MAKFYFTYGSDERFPFRGGWTEVIAPNRSMAVEAFRAVHPDINENTINCSFVYTEDDFKTSCMADGSGNMKKFCHDRITLTVETCDPDEVINLQTGNTPA